jgi:hypothetical protein
MRRDMAAHTSDASIHFTGMATKLLQMSEKVNKLEAENDELTAKVKVLEKDVRVTFLWEIPKFDTTKVSYVSPDFQAFGHTLILRLVNNNIDFYKLALNMKSRMPDKLGYEFIVGRYNAAEASEHVKSQNSLRLLDFSAEATNGTWGWGYDKFAALALTEFTREKLLTPEGALQIKAVIYKVL